MIPTPVLVLFLLLHLTSPDLTYQKTGDFAGSGALNPSLSSRAQISIFGKGFEPWNTVGVRERESSCPPIGSRLSTGPGSGLASSNRRGCPGFQKTSSCHRSISACNGEA